MVPLRDTPIVEVLSISIGPVILISGIGLLLLSLTNRYGRVIDRARHLGDLRRKSGNTCQFTGAQIGILRKRAHIIRLSISFAVWALLFAAVLVIGIFLSSLVRLPASGFIVAMFVGCLLCLIVALMFFLLDINQSLRALDLDLRE